MGRAPLCTLALALAGALLLSLAFFSVPVSAKLKGGRCKACHELGLNLEARLAETEHRAAEEVQIGKRVGADGKSTSSKNEPYGNS
jgi:hypothetical protein